MTAFCPRCFHKLVSAPRRQGADPEVHGRPHHQPPRLLAFKPRKQFRKATVNTGPLAISERSATALVAMKGYL